MTAPGPQRPKIPGKDRGYYIAEKPDKRRGPSKCACGAKATHFGYQPDGCVLVSKCEWCARVWLRDIAGIGVPLGAWDYRPRGS